VWKGGASDGKQSRSASGNRAGGNKMHRVAVAPVRGEERPPATGLRLVGRSGGFGGVGRAVRPRKLYYN